MSLAKQALAVSLLATLPIAAQATAPSSTFNFYFDGGLLDEVSNAPSYVSGGLQLIVRAFDINGQQLQVAQRWDGLGATTGGLIDNTDINANAGFLFTPAAADYLTLTFNQAVNLTGVRLSHWSDLPLINDTATLSWGGKSFGLGSNNDHGIPLATFSPTGATGTTFKLQATGSSSFRLAGVNVTAAVPEPGSYALMALGLAALGVAVRRRQG